MKKSNKNKEAVNMLAELNRPIIIKNDKCNEFLSTMKKAAPQKAFWDECKKAANTDIDRLNQIYDGAKK